MCGLQEKNQPLRGERDAEETEKGDIINPVLTNNSRSRYKLMKIIHAFYFPAHGAHSHSPAVT